MDIKNEIQSWIAVRSFAVEDANPQAPIIDANELAEFVTEVFKKLEGCVVVPKGYVLVDAESLVLHARSIRIFNTGEQYSEDIEDHVCSIEAMIEAQEPTND